MVSVSERPTLSPSIFFFNDTATTEIYTLSLHDALPIYGRAGVDCVSRRPRWPPPRSGRRPRPLGGCAPVSGRRAARRDNTETDRKSTRLNSSHANISYAVFCLKKKKSLKSLLSTVSHNR